MIYYAFLSGYMFYGFLLGLLQADWINASLAGLLCIMWLIGAFVAKKNEELKQDD